VIFNLNRRERMIDKLETLMSGLGGWVASRLGAGHSPGKIAVDLERAQPGLGRAALPLIHQVSPARGRRGEAAQSDPEGASKYGAQLQRPSVTKARRPSDIVGHIQFGAILEPRALRRPAPLSPTPDYRDCIVNAHGLQNDLPTRAPRRTGAYGVAETVGTAALDARQLLPPGSEHWTNGEINHYLGQYRERISGYDSAGRRIFNGMSDNMGGGRRGEHIRRLERIYPDRVLFELPGGPNLEDVDDMILRVPDDMSCPVPGAGRGGTARRR
jgi:hypothetical protein